MNPLKLLRYLPVVSLANYIRKENKQKKRLRLSLLIAHAAYANLGSLYVQSALIFSDLNPIKGYNELRAYVAERDALFGDILQHADAEGNGLNFEELSDICSRGGYKIYSVDSGVSLLKRMGNAELEKIATSYKQEAAQ